MSIHALPVLAPRINYDVLNRFYFNANKNIVGKIPQFFELREIGLSSVSSDVNSLGGCDRNRFFTLQNVGWKIGITLTNTQMFCEAQGWVGHYMF